MGLRLTEFSGAISLLRYFTIIFGIDKILLWCDHESVRVIGEIIDILAKTADAYSQFLEPEDHEVRAQLAKAQEAANLPYAATRDPFSTTPYRIDDPADASAVIDWFVYSVRMAYRTDTAWGGRQSFFDCNLGDVSPRRTAVIHEQLSLELHRREVHGVAVEVTLECRAITEHGYPVGYVHWVNVRFTLSD